LATSPAVRVWFQEAQQHRAEDSKRPPRKRKAVPLEGPAIVRKGAAKPETPPAPANDDRKPAIVTVKRRNSRFGDAPDLTPEEHRRRGDAADTLFREMVRRAAGKT
jgi:hypothetical protein